MIMTPLPFPHEAIESSVPARFAAVAAAFGDHSAVVAGETTLSYYELDRASNRLACAIAGASDGAIAGASDGTILDESSEQPDSLARAGMAYDMNPVALLCSHDAGLVVGILGILKAGRAYVSLMDSHPRPHLERLIEHLGARIIVCDAVHLSLARSLAASVGSNPENDVPNVAHRGRVVCLDEMDAAVSKGAQDGAIPPERIAVINFTSGSTGEPKGVMRNHRLLLHRVWFAIHHQQIGPDDRISLLYSASFGSSQADLFGALLTGATLCIYDLRTQGVAPLAGWINDRQVTCLHLPAEMFRQWLQVLETGVTFPSLRQVAPAGRIFQRDIEAARSHLPAGCMVITRLASSETGVVAQMMIDAHGPFPASAPESPGVLPVGYVIPDTEIVVLDDDGQPAPPGQIGEAVIIGPYLAAGYWRRPDLTATAFTIETERPLDALRADISDAAHGRLVWRRYRLGDLVRMRPNGLFEYHGRRDERVKVRGYTVELGAVETALSAVPGVRAAAVIALPTADGDRRLVAFVSSSGAEGPRRHDSGSPESRVTAAASAGGSEPSAEDWRRALAQVLPSYMIPSAFVTLAELPLTPTGKIDRQLLIALAPAASTRPNLTTPYIAPANPTEISLAGIWAEVLGLDAVGVHDNFLDLGGNSILAARIVARVMQRGSSGKGRADKPISFAELFAAPTVAGMAALIEPARDEEVPGLAALLAELEALSDQAAEQMLSLA